MRFLSRLSAAAWLALVASAGADATTLTFTCTSRDSGKDVPFTATYDGDARGTLTLKSADGEMDLKATYIEQDADNWGINGVGPASLIMPDKAAMEACLAAKGKPGDLQDADILTVLVLGCQSTVKASATPVAISAEVEIADTDGELDTFVTRKYADASPVAGGHIELASVPPPVCVKQ
jgi:hypothetical protein